MHVLWKGCVESYSDWQLRVLEQIYVEAALARGIPLFNKRWPLAVTHPQFVSEVHQAALIQLATDPSFVIREWVHRVLDYGWDATAVGKRVLDPFVGTGTRLDDDPEFIQVQPF